MNNLKKMSAMLAVAIMVSTVSTGCGANEEVKLEETENVQELEENAVVEEMVLEDWAGTWNNMGAYLEDDELQEAFKELAENEGLSVEEAKKQYLEKRKADFDGMIIDENSVTFLDGFSDKSGKEIGKAEYLYKDTCIVKHGNFDVEWYAFETEEEVDYKILLMMPVHGEEALTHFHMRYGNDLDELLARDDWYPTFVKPNSTYEQLYEEIVE